MLKRLVIAASITAPLIVGYLAASPAASGVPANSSSVGTVRVLASHLDNPRGLAARGARVFVAESGHGGSTCRTDPSPPHQVTCVGLTGGVSVVSSAANNGPHAARRVVHGLISLASPSGAFAGGASAVSLEGRRIFLIMGGNTYGLPPGLPVKLRKAAKAQVGQLIAAKDNSFTPILGVGDLDYRWSARHKELNPRDFPDSNPNAVLVEGDVTYVVDAGTNTLDTVRDGRITHRMYFGVPSGSPTDSVPTCLSRGPDGALYVGELLGGNFAPGHARIWRVSGAHKSVWARGLTAVNGCGWGHDGKFYATEFQVNGLTEGPGGSPAGDLVQISRNGKTHRHLATGQLTLPSGFAPGDDGVFVSNCSTAPATGFGPCPHGGQLVRITTS